MFHLNFHAQNYLYFDCIVIQKIFYFAKWDFYSDFQTPLCAELSNFL